MERSDWYISAPNDIVLCVDQKVGQLLKGRFYHAYSEEALPVASTEQILFRFEQFFDAMGFPHPTTLERSFGVNEEKNAKQERTRKMSDKELLSKHGELGTFIVRVQHRQNSSWQGRITWMEKNRTLNFRSVWELLKLIVSAVETVQEVEEEPEEEPSWFEEGE